MINDGVNTLTYDAENHLLTSSGSLGSGAYVYDGNGVRVKKCVPNCTSPTSTTLYAFSGSKVIAEYVYVSGTPPTSPTREYIYSRSALIAKIEGTVTQYYHSDHLSARVMTDSSGNKIGEQGHFPYGETWYPNNTTTKWEFTSYERDAESGNDYAMARYNVNRLGRFSAPDPLSGSIRDPQSLNRYSYVVDDPIDHVDPLGLYCEFYPSGCGYGGGDPSGIYGRFGEGSPGCGDACGGGGGGDKDEQVRQAKQLVHTILQGDNLCSQFFNDSLDLLIDSVLSGTRVTADMIFSTQTIARVDFPANISATTTQGGGVQATINLNNAGAFFNQIGLINGEHKPLQEGNSSGGTFAGGSLGAQATILLHEIAHTIDLIRNDSPAVDPTGKINDKNTQTILDHCLSTIKSTIQSSNDQ